MEVTEDVVGEVNLFGGSRIVEVDVTSTVQKWSDGTLENYGWLIEALGTRNGAISTKETSQFIPKLTVTYTRVGGDPIQPGDANLDKVVNSADIVRSRKTITYRIHDNECV